MMSLYRILASGAFLMSAVYSSPTPKSSLLTSTIDTPPSFEHLTPRHPQTQVQRTRIKYGPFTVPGMDTDGGMKSFQAKAMAKPCSDCTITYLQAGLEYPNGSYANADTGMWLHHAVIFNGAKRDTSCPETYERAMASGNERTPIDFTRNGTIKAGYYIGPSDPLGLGVELMNEAMLPRDAVLTLDWEYIPGLPSDFASLVPVWLDIDGVCDPRASEVPPPAGNTSFSFVMEEPWTANFSARVFLAAGHVHDGGTDIQIVRNGVTVCDSVARYGESAGYVQMVGMEMGGGTMEMEMQHISSMGKCEGLSMEVGDTWGVKANYDFGMHAGMMDGEKMAPVMGIALLYVVRE